jgi:hypothetical protein
MASTDMKSKRRSPVVLAAGVILSATLALGTFSGTANAEHRDDHRGHDWHRGGGGGWGGGYYRAPPVVYGSPYYAAPPVVYGPGFGINLNIR